MENYYLLTYIEEGIEVDLIKEINIDKIRMVPVTFDYIKNLSENIKKDNIKVLGIEPYSLIQFKLKIMDDYIEKNND